MRKDGCTGAEGGRKSDNFSRASALSRLLFLWTLPTFLRGSRKELDLDDLSRSPDCDLSQQLTEKLERNWFDEERKAKAAGRSPSLRRALIRTFFWQHVPDALLYFIYFILKTLQPKVLALMLSYWEPGSGVTRSSALGYAGLLVAMVFFTCLSYHHAYVRSSQYGMRLRVACSSLLYRKVIRMDSAALNAEAAGKVVNLLSNDAARFERVFAFLPCIWVFPFQLLLLCYLMYTVAGLAAIIGIAATLVETIPLQTYLTHLMGKYRLKVALSTDARINLMNEIISGIQVIKMYGWEQPFEAVVSARRRREVDLIAKSLYILGVNSSFVVFTERFTLYCTLLAYTLLGNRVTSAVVFSMAQFFNVLQGSIAYHIPNAATGLSELLVSIDRLGEFLDKCERPDEGRRARLAYYDNSASVNDVKSKDNLAPIHEGGHLNPSYDKSTEELVLGEKEIAVLDGVTAYWNGDNTQPALNDVSLRIGRGKLCAIVGSVGSGKSSLLELLLGELRQCSGRVKIGGSVSYASQKPWLFVATVRQNILFGLPYDPQKYAEVVRVCALEKDMKQFPRGDQTLVGERGVSLSGGQRARINLARAVYRDADIYLLDDPLSAVDAPVGRQLFKECIEGYLRGRTTLLVTHQLHHLKTADLLVIMNDAKVERATTLDELVSTGHNIADILSLLGEGEEDEEETNSDTIPQMRRMSSTRSNTTTSKLIYEAETLEEEERQMGSQSKSLYGEYWKAGSNWFVIIAMCLVMVIGQLSATASDFWVTYWTNAELEDSSKYVASVSNVVNATFSANTTPLMDLHRKVGRFTPAEYLYVYTALVIACICLTITRTAVFFKLSSNSSKGLHDKMFHTLLQGAMRFFDTNPSGRILNRFSKDIGAVDEQLPRAALSMVQIFLVGCSIVILVAISMFWLLIPVAFFTFVILYFMLPVYLRSAQAIKRLEGTTKSPVFSHLTCTMNGITTIRCAHAQRTFISEFDEAQDVHTSTFNHYVACSETLGFWLDALLSVFLTIVTFSFLLLDESSVGVGNCGLAISQSIILTGMLQFGIQQGAQVISEMTSVERVVQYTRIPTEKTGGIVPDPSWPQRGSLRMSSVSLKYADDKPAVLQDLNLIVEPGWKVGIVGRTGAGKTSLISALFRLAKVEGIIEIDGINTDDLALQSLRSKISIIPQEPVLFSASIRYNLDPFDVYDDASLWQSLEDVELKESIPSLEFVVSNGGSNLSLGQRQLLCLARAILRNNRILVLDEATANVDPETDALIQKTIRRKFGGCTVLTVAHRLNSVIDSDRVLVLEGGRAREFAHPHRLLADPDTLFAAMVRDTGPDMSRRLHQQAHRAYLLQTIY